jgi:hypothetical protein
MIPFPVLHAYVVRRADGRRLGREGEASMTNVLSPLKAAVAAASLAGFVSIAVAGVSLTDRVDAGETNIHRVWTRSGNSRVVVDGDGDTDLDCYVYDRSGNMIGFDNDITDYCIVAITQRRGGEIVIEIENLGTVYNQYRLHVE